MKKCKSYNCGCRYSVFDGAPYEQGYCSATKECESCSCGGDELKCDFYEYIRERARAEQSTVIEAFSINEDTLMRRLIERSIKEEQQLPWWVCQEIYNYHNKGE